MSRRAVSALALLLAALGLAPVGACRPSAPPGPEELPVAEVDDHVVTLADLDLYLAFNLLEGEPSEDGDDERAADQVKSRLLDAYIDEWLLAREAGRRGLDVAEDEVAAYLGRHPASAEEPPLSPTPALISLVRRRLLVEQLQENLVRDLPQIEEEEVRDYMEEHRKELSPERRLVLRALMLPTAEQARHVHGLIADHRMTFADALETYRTDPGQGASLEVSWDGLSPELRSALQDLPAGGVSRPLVHDGQSYIFQVEGWLDDPVQLERQLIHRAHLDLERRRRQWAVEALLHDLRNKSRITIRGRNLPFHYMKTAVG